MEQTVWLAVGALAVLASGLAMLGRVDRDTRTIASIGATVLWAFWALGAQNVVVVRGCHDDICAYTQTYSGLTAIGVGFAVIMLLAFIRSAFSQLGNEPMHEEVI